MPDETRDVTADDPTPGPTPPREADERCRCLCHIDGVACLHCVPCCTISGRKFIAADGTIDEARYQAALAAVTTLTTEIQ